MADAARHDPLVRYRLVGVLATLAIVLSVPLYLVARSLRAPRASVPPEALYVGSERCAPCHKAAYEAWKGSHHELAMQAARDDTVLGDFNDARFELRGKTWRFFRRGERFMVLAEGPDDTLHEYEVAYTFGIDPLQQYLIPFPGGRLQCLSVAWDTRARRWFFLYPGRDIPPSDWLHWTRQAQNWNTMCADCHSTAVRKRYDVPTDTFHTTWSEIMVGCEACHGPGSRHAAWADQPAMARPQVDNHALVTRTSGLSNREVVDLCAPCHARRAQIADQGIPGTPFLDRYLPVLLTPGTFWPDGQILDEDYEYHSFIQSKMFANNVSCRDCHDVHRAKRRTDGNALCTRCHRADTYDTEAHHFHKRVFKGAPSAGALCTSCHMPGQLYMVVHFRVDHSLRVPRPDLSAALGVPNACTAAGCHADRSVAWAVEKYDAWYGKQRKPHYGTVLAAGHEGRPDAGPELVRLAQDQLRPAIARATAVELLSRFPGESTTATLEKALADDDALIRQTAASSLRPADPARLVRALVPLLKDPVRAVRTASAARLAEVPPGLLTQAQRATLAAALEEYVAVQLYGSDMPSGPYNLANLEVLQGRDAEAEQHYRRTLGIDGQFFPAKSNLALLLARTGRTAEAEGLLREIHAEQPGNAGVAFNLGLLLAERGNAAEAETALRAALAADPTMAAAAYNLAVLLAPRRPAEAVELSRRAAQARPEEPRYAWTLAYYQAASGDQAGAARTLEELLRFHPGDADAALLLGEILARGGKPAEAEAVLRRTLEAKDLKAADRARIAQRLSAAPSAP
ncbi:MAG: tetratricopeptide repeat protein [Thermoanaerobaculaceae bacterium]|jgi:Flp pilus assembly protein TadD|nr:tetratricopeptide repeat protein [Thermoanaerobaculaceae bacterium]